MNSSSKDKTQWSKGPVSKEEVAKVKLIFDALEVDAQAYDFLEPVDYAGKLQIIIKNM